MKRKIGILIFIILIIIGISNYSKASSFNFTVNTNKTEVEPGEEVTVEIKLSDIDMGEKGINVVEGKLEYDKNFLEMQKFEDNNEWRIIYNSGEGELKGKFLIDKMDEGIKTDESIAKIKFKVKEDVKQEETQIKIKGIKSNDGQNLIDEEDKEVTLKLKKSIYNVNNKRENAKTGDNILLIIGAIIVIVLINVAILIVRKRSRK